MPPLLSALVVKLCPGCLGSCLGPVDSPSCCVPAPWLPSFAPHRRPSLAFDRRYQKKHAVLARDITSPIRSPRHQASTHHILFLHIACPGPAVGPSLGKCYFLVRSSYIFPDGLLSPPPTADNPRAPSIFISLHSLARARVSASSSPSRTLFLGRRSPPRSKISVHSSQSTTLATGAALFDGLVGGKHIRHTSSLHRGRRVPPPTIYRYSIFCAKATSRLNTPASEAGFQRPTGTQPDGSADSAR
jgi:hypothetical protein